MSVLVTMTTRLPTHRNLPETDGKPRDNLLEPSQASLLTSAVRPVLNRIHPDGRYLIGSNNGIYWRLTDPPLDGCKVPDWFFVPGVDQGLPGEYRRSYVMWQELRAPTLIIEFVSGDGRDERDETEMQGKFWVYEKAIRAPYYAIYLPDPGAIDFYKLDGERYRKQSPNERGHFPVPEMQVELGIWEGTYDRLSWTWLRFYDHEGRLLPTDNERAEAEHHRAEAERLRAERLAAKLLELGIDPKSV